MTPKQVLALKGTRFTSAYRGKLERYRYGSAAFKLDWALDGPIPWASEICARSAVVHLGGELEELEAAERAWTKNLAPERPYVLLVQPTLFDPLRAPRGKHVAWAYGHFPPGSATDFTSLIEAQVERFAPGFKKLILARSRMNGTDLERHNPNLVGGDVLGGLGSLGQMLFRPAFKLSPYTTPMEGVYLCSASTPPGPGVHGMAGFHAAQQMLKADA